MRRPIALMVAFLICGLFSFAFTLAMQERSDHGQQRPTTRPADMLGQWLQLLPDQVQSIAAVDPDYAAERDALAAQLQAARERLAALFEAPETAPDEIRQQVETVIEIHDRLERRVAAYLLAIRPHLTDQQRARLFARCADTVREAGRWRWRHGRRGGGEGAQRQRGRGGGWGRRGGGPPWQDDTADDRQPDG